LIVKLLWFSCTISDMQNQ